MLVRADFMAIEWSGLTGSCLIALTSEPITTSCLVRIRACILRQPGPMGHVGAGGERVKVLGAQDPLDDRR